MVFNYTPRNIITLICVLGAFVGTGFVYSVPGPFYPKFAEKDRHVSKPLVGFTVSSFNIAGIVVSAALLVFPQPRLAKLFFILGTSLEGVGMVFFGLAFWVEDKVGFEVACVIARVVAGIGNSFLWASGPTLLCQILPEDKARSSAWIIVSYYLGYSSGPVIGGFLFPLFGHSSPFIFVGVYQVTTASILFLCLLFCPFEVGNPSQQPTNPDSVFKHLKFFKWNVGLLPLGFFCASVRAAFTQVSLVPYLYTTFGTNPADAAFYFSTPDALCKSIGSLVFATLSYKGYFGLLYGINSILLGFPILALSFPAIWETLECPVYIGVMVALGAVPTSALGTSFLLLMSKVLVDVAHTDLETSLFLAGALYTTTGHVGFVFGPIAISGLLEAFLGFYIAYAIVGLLMVAFGFVVLKVLLDLKMFKISVTSDGKNDENDSLLPDN